MSYLDPAIGPFRFVADSPSTLTLADPDPTWTLPELTKLAWVAKRIKVSYRFQTANQGNYITEIPVYWGWSILENQRDEPGLVCYNNFQEVEQAPWAGYPDLAEDDPLVVDGGVQQIYAIFGCDWNDSGGFISINNYPSDEAFGVLPTIGFWAGYTTYYLESEDPAPDETIGCVLSAGSPPEDASPYVKTREAMIEVITRDNSGNPKSVFYNAYADVSGWPVDNPIVGGENPWAGTPNDWGFRIDLTTMPYGESTIDVTPYIKVEVLEWYSYNGTWDTETGELLADPWA